MFNIEVRNLIKQNRFLYYEVAQKLSISHSTLSVWLRTPLTDERKKRVLEAIEELKEEVI